MTVKIEMDMPKNCKECRFMEWTHGVFRCSAKGLLLLETEEVFDGIRNKRCPLKEVKENL